MQTMTARQEPGARHALHRVMEKECSAPDDTTIQFSTASMNAEACCSQTVTIGAIRQAPATAFRELGQAVYNSHSGWMTISVCEAELGCRAWYDRLMELPVGDAEVAEARGLLASLMDPECMPGGQPVGVDGCTMDERELCRTLFEEQHGREPTEEELEAELEAAESLGLVEERWTNSWGAMRDTLRSSLGDGSHSEH